MKRSSTVKIVSICAIFSLLFGFVGGGLSIHFFGNDDTTNLFQTIAKPITGELIEGKTSIEKVASVGTESVVEIKTEAVSYSQFFPEVVAEGAGSGVVISTDGYIVTNYHVIDGANRITVTTKDKKSYNAEVIGRDVESDLAVLRIKEKELAPAVMGNSGEVRLGQQAIVIGNPLGELGGSVTSGIISSLSREINVDNQEMTLIQTDASINPGNSGGGLFNDNGELIGVVVAKSSGEDVEGLGFAIPIDRVKKVTESIIQNGYVTGKPVLGVSVFQYEEDEFGVHIESVDKGSAADEAGLREGDIMIKVDGEVVIGPESVQKVIASHEVGDKITIQIIRDGNEKTVNATLKEKKE